MYGHIRLACSLERCVHSTKLCVFIHNDLARIFLTPRERNRRKIAQTSQGWGEGEATTDYETTRFCTSELRDFRKTLRPGRSVQLCIHETSHSSCRDEIGRRRDATPLRRQAVARRFRKYRSLAMLIAALCKELFTRSRRNEQKRRAPCSYFVAAEMRVDTHSSECRD